MRQAISDNVWRRGWRREATETQEAAQAIAAFIQWLEQHGLAESARIVRAVAMQHGARRAAVEIIRVFTRRRTG